MDGLVPFLQDLVRIHSVNGRDTEKELALRIQKEAEKLNIECKLYASPETPDRPNAVASIGTGEPLFSFVAHADTVAEGIVEDWKSGPFDAIIDNTNNNDNSNNNNNIIGRGVADNKGGIAAALYALALLKQNGFDEKKGKIIVAAVVDEESGACSEHGLQYLLKNKIIGGKGAIYCHIGTRVTIGHRGLIRLLLSVRGQACHSGIHEWCTGERGSNASMALCEALLNIENYNWPLALHDAFPKLRFTVTPGTLLKGGEYESMVPPYAEALIDMRTMPDQDQDAIINKINEILDDVIKRRNEKILSIHDPKISNNPQLLSSKIIIKNKLPSAHISPSHPLSLACKKSVKDILNEEVECTGCGPANEGYMLIGAGIPTICGFGYEGGNPHAPNEWVSVKSLKETVKVYAEVVRNYCSV